MNTTKKIANGTAGRSSRRRVLRDRALPGMERLETRMLPAGIIHVYSGAPNTTIPIGAEDFGDPTNYDIDPSAFTSAVDPIDLQATTSITFSDPVTGVTVALTAESHGVIQVFADVSTTSGHDITLISDNSGTSGAVNQDGVTVANSVVTSGGNLSVHGTGYGNASGGNTSGVTLTNGVLTTSGMGTVTVVGDLGTVDHGGNVGVLVAGSG
jgi:hypothetical protein